MKIEKRNLYVIGAGGYGREICSYLKNFSDEELDWNLKGFIDDNKEALQGVESPYKILGSISDFHFNKEDYVIIAIGNIEIKKQIVKTLKNRVSFYTLIAKNSYVGNNVTLGKGVVICPGVKLPANISIGDFVTINLDSRIGHDCIIGNNCSIMPNVDIGGGCMIGGNNFFGTKSTIIPRIKIKPSNYIGAASVVLKDIITSNGTYFGNPARRMK